MEVNLEGAPTHAVRVGAIARELGAAFGFDEITQRRLQEAGWHHECVPELFVGGAFSRLTADLLGQAQDVPARFVDAETFAICRPFPIHIYHGSGQP
jgi:hypothetical protein